MKKFTFILLLMAASCLFSHEGNIHINSKYLYFGIGTGTGNLKDMGTSPLRYNGSASEMQGGYIRNKEISNFEILGHFSYFLGMTDEQYSLQHYVGAFDGSYMHTLPIFKSPHPGLSIGGDFFTSLSGNYNPSYQNASLNIDMKVKLSLLAQFDYKMHIKEINTKFAGIRFHVPKKDFTGFARLNLPVILFNGRPEFSYVNENELGIFDRHYFFGGINLNTQLGLKHHLQNGNIIELSYLWEVHHTGLKDIYLFEKSSHIFYVALFFKLN